MAFLSYLANGISLGSVYAIIALGYTMVYGIAKMLNFAHGDVIMVGAYIAFCATSYLGLPSIVAILLAMAVCTILGITIEGLAYKPLRAAPSLAVLITAIGVSYFLQNAALLIWGSAPKSFPSLVGIPPLKLFEGKLIITGEAIVTVIACIVIMIGLTLFTGKTRMGKAMRAVSEDKGAAQLMGINVNHTISVTFAIGSILACASGLMVGVYFDAVFPTMGYSYGIKAFAAAVLGGIGSLPGAMVGGLTIGLIESLGAAYISSGYRNAFAFGIMIIVLIFRPGGIFGKATREKV